LNVLVIRFSSFGDICQCLFAVQALRERSPNAKVDWLTRADFAEFLGGFSDINQVYSLDRQKGFFCLL